MPFAQKSWLEKAVSRVLFLAAVPRDGVMIIPLGLPLPTASSNRTRELRTGRPQTLPYLVLLRMGFTELPTSPPELVSSYLTLSPLPVCAETRTGGLLSVALSLGSPPVPVRDHPALRSPDFPPAPEGASDHLSFSSRLPLSMSLPEKTRGQRGKTYRRRLQWGQLWISLAVNRLLKSCGGRCMLQPRQVSLRASTTAIPPRRSSSI